MRFPLLALLALPVSAGAQSSPRADVSVTLRPARPVPGALVRLVARGAADSITGTFGDQPLHFRRQKDGTWLALGGVPVDADTARGIALAWRAWPAGGDDSTTVALAPPPYRSEKLRVAPEFGREPDSALAARLEAESAKALAVSRASHETPRLWAAPFARPRPGRVTSGFGNAREFNGVVRSRHMGTDFAGAEGAPIVAVNRGVVRLADRFYLGGNVVYVDHGDGLVTAYLHLSRTDVAVGDTVRKGQRIGRVGSTGRVTGPHLHFIVRQGTVTVDPMTLLGSMGAAPPRASSPRRR